MSEIKTITGVPDETTPYGKPVINFDEASKLWRANKRNPRMSKSFFEYCCGALKPNGEFCKAPPNCWTAGYRRRLRDTEEYDELYDGVKQWGYCTKHLHLEKPDISKSENISDKQTV